LGFDKILRIDRACIRKKPMGYKKPKRMFEDAGLVDPRSAYHVDLERVVNTKNQDLKTMVDRGRYFSIFDHFF